MITETSGRDARADAPASPDPAPSGSDASAAARADARSDATPSRTARRGSPPPSRGRRVAMIALAAAVLAAAAGIAVWGTPSSDTKPSAAGGHDHAAMAAGGARQRALTLSDADARRIGVTYAVAQMVPLRREIRTVGQVTFDETRVTTVSPRIEGWVERLYVNATGQPITAGAPMLSVYSPTLVTAQEELLLARRLAGDMRDASPEARRSADDLIASARRRLAWWDVPATEITAIERSGRVRRALTLRAPSSGHVLEKNVTQGQRIMPGDVLYRVADLRTVWVEGEVFEQDLPAVRTGEMVHVDLQALPGEHYMGRIAHVYPTLDAETRTARVRVELPNAGLRLKPGMYATIRVEGAAGEPVLSVPRSALLVTGERSLVFVRGAGGRLLPRDVRAGAATGDRVAILSGLAAGDTVVASATFLVDAESNLGSALRGMGDTPGAEVPTPPERAAPAGRAVPVRERATPPGASPPGAPRPEAAPPAAPDPHAGHGR